MPDKSVSQSFRRPLLALRAAVTDPIEAWVAFQDRLASRREAAAPAELYEADDNWEQRLHQYLDLSSSCPIASEFWALWPEVMDEMRRKGIRVGPESFKGWNDGDAGLVRAIWLLVRHLHPQNVVETGVAHGVTSRFILEALKKNGSGHLWSIDHQPLERELHAQIGVAVGDGHTDRWTYIKGSSRVRLPSLLSKLGEIDLFIHDSLHSERNVLFEISQVWPKLRNGGAIVIDDIDANRAFHSLSQTLSGFPSLICEAEPLEPDHRRANKKGLFGIFLKLPALPQD